MKTQTTHKIGCMGSHDWRDCTCGFSFRYMADCLEKNASRRGGSGAEDRAKAAKLRQEATQLGF